MAILLAVCLGMLAYVLVGYPLLLRVLVAIRGARPVRHADITPRLSFVISAFNEADVIRRKIENTLSLDYPADRREIVVISDASDDGTDEIVEEFRAQGVRLARQTERRGKTAGLNRTIPTLTGDVIVFSDANAIYEPDALRKLVRNFADETVGYVTGEARYLEQGQSVADVGERTYWNYEIQMKRLETALWSMVGGDGAIYSIRRQLWQTLPEDAINDFLNPLQIIAAGWRGVYEPEAVCWEETAGATRSEYRRRVRIVSRSWRAVFQAGSVINPLKVGLFAWCLWSHKILRWAAGLFVIGAVIAGAALYVRALFAMPVPVSVITGVAVLALAGTSAGRRAVATGGYFAALNAASLVGLYRGSIGRVSGIWSTPRAQVQPHRSIPVGRLFLWAVLFGVLGMMVAPLVLGITGTTLLFWGSMSALIYVYLGYPALLAVARVLRPRPVRKAGITPSVAVLIAANNEAAVMGRKLQNTLALDYPVPIDIVVASDGSTDETNAIARSFAPRVRLLERSPRQGKSAALRNAMEAITSDIVVFSDANTFLDRDAVRALVANFADPSVGGVSADVALVGDRASLASSEDLYYRYERWVQQAESDIGSMVGADGALYAIRRELFEPPPEDTILDDMAIPMGVVRRGFRVVFERGARATESGVGAAWEEFSRKARVVAGAVQFLRRRDSAVPSSAPQVALALVSHKGLRWLSPVFGGIWLVTSIGLATTYAAMGVLALAQTLVLLVGLLGCWPRLRTIKPIALVHYFLLIQAAAVVGVTRGIRGRQSVLWKRFGRVQAAPQA